jgi:hypothetical protein
LKNAATAPDPEQAFRFLDRGTLRVVVGVPPLPRLSAVPVAVKPFAERIEPGQRLDLRLTFPQPVNEYNPYFADDENQRYTDVTASEIELVIQYLPESKGVVATPAQWSWAASLYSVRPLSHLGGAWPGAYVRASATVPDVHARLRVGEFERIALPPP